MIEKYSLLHSDLQKDAPKEIMLLSIISQSFFQPFSLEDNLLVILTALTSGSGVGFNRAMLLLKEGDILKGQIWLGPRSAQEAQNIWEILSTPGIGYIEIIEHNRLLVSIDEDTLSRRIKKYSCNLEQDPLTIPALSALSKEIMLVRDAGNEPSIDGRFREIIGVDEFLCIPLVGRDEVMGEIIVDNAITKKAIDMSAIKLASLCGLIAGNYLYSTTLHNKLMEMEKMAALGEMASFIAHQLRNPLVTIGGFTDQLLTSPCDEGRQKRNLQIIRDEIQRLERIVYKIAHFLKINFRQPMPFEIRKVIESTLSRPEIQAKAREVNLQLKLAKCTPQILCEPTHLGEVIYNVLDNALDATPPGGKVSIRGYPKNSKWFVISIKDSGKGIPDDVLNKLFQPFFTTKKLGIGLGLIFVKRVMDSCGGRIEIQSKPGKGSLSRLYFQIIERTKPG